MSTEDPLISKQASAPTNGLLTKRRKVVSNQTAYSSCLLDRPVTARDQKSCRQAFLALGDFRSLAEPCPSIPISRSTSPCSKERKGKSCTDHSSGFEFIRKTTPTMFIATSKPQLRFINETTDGAPGPRTMSNSKRRQVRSHAMIAVRRKQRLDAEVHQRLKWTVPKSVESVESPKDGTTTCVGKRKDGSEKSLALGKFDFVEQAYPMMMGTGKPKRESNRTWTECDSTGYGHRGKKANSKLDGSQQGSLPLLVGKDCIERIGGGRRNPFESYPIPINTELLELMDHCKWLFRASGVGLIPTRGRYMHYSNFHVRHQSERPDAKSSVLPVFQ